MSTQNAVAAGAESENRWIYQAGGISALLVLVGYAATFPVYFSVGTPPEANAGAQLAYFGAHATGWWVITGLMVATDLLLIPVFLALYHALKGRGRDMMLIALALEYLFVALDPLVTWTPYSALIIAGGRYAAATTDAARAALIAGAGYPSAMIDWPLAGLYAIVIPAVAVLLTGLVMLRGVFGKPTAYLAVAMGVTGIAYLGSYLVSALEPIYYLNAMLAMVWFGFVGVGLLRLGRR